MSEPKLISPLLDNYMMGDVISEKAGSRCCPALERDLQTKCIVKIISTPASQAQLDALLLSGAYPDTQAALKYFETIAQGIVDEAGVLKRLSQLEGFFPYTDWQLLPMDDGVGYDVYAISEYRKTLHKLLKGENLTHLAAVNLGLDICTALAVCRRIGYLYVNLKPENIYLADNKTWKIGDIGFVRLDSLKYASLPERYRSEYTAPEIEDAFASLNTTLDVYALGLVLYRIYNGNQLPANIANSANEALVPPDYADYEMSEIIMKACDPNPEMRWQDPIEMGQALVSYMQRNSVNDTPIIPPPVVTEEPQIESEGSTNSETVPVETLATADMEAEEETTTEIVQEEISDTVDDTVDDELSKLLAPADDETAPEQNEDQLTDISVTSEVSDILSQAEELSNQSVPQMPEHAEPSETNNTTNNEETLASITDEVVEETHSEESSQESAEVINEVASEELVASVPIEDLEEGDEKTSASADETAAQESSEPDNTEITTDAFDEEEEDEETSSELVSATEARKPHLLRNILIACAALILAALVFLFYTKYYVQKIDALDIVKSPNGEVSVHIVTHADSSKLTVICADAYGNPRKAAVKDGIAVFDNLAPASAYTVKVEIEGFHKLTGNTTASFTTPNQIEIMQLEALTGQEDGSVILTFTTKEQDSEQWSVTYGGDDGTKIVEIFEGHICTIRGLTVGKEYVFTIAPESDIKYTGTTEVKHTAASVVVAENIRIQGIADGKMTVTWTAPTGSNVTGWNIHCYNTNGFDQMLTTDTTSAVIDGIDTTEPYTIEVSAVGMSMTTRTDVPANAITVTNFTATQDNTMLLLSWECGNDNAPTDWLLSYSIDGVATQEVTCNTQSFEIENAIPDATYIFTLKTADTTDVLGGQLSITAAKAEKFSAYKVTAADMRFHACRTPSKSNWSKKDLKASDYTTTFKVGEKLSFLAELKDTYNPSNDQIVTMFVFRNEDGSAVEFSTITSTWKQMWYKGLGELDVPATPGTPGQYTVSIYMNGKLAGESKITITQ